MEYKVESSLWNFPAWSGGKDTLDVIIEKGDCQEVEDLIETVFLERDATDEDINDFLWFERDTIAEHLGYRDWEAYEEGWSESDLQDAEEWWADCVECLRTELSGTNDESAQDDWWESLDDEKKVEIYYQNS